MNKHSENFTTGGKYVPNQLEPQFRRKSREEVPHFDSFSGLDFFDANIVKLPVCPSSSGYSETSRKLASHCHSGRSPSEPNKVVIAR